MAAIEASPVLAATPQARPGTTQLMHSGGGTIAYDDSGGDGPLVVCVPGLGDVRAQYRFLAPRLRDAGFRVVTMDLRGAGESSANWSDYSPAATGADIIALLDQVGGAHATVLANSFAGASAVWAAAQAPARIDTIVLIDPFVRDIPPSMIQGAMLKLLLMRPWAVWAWSQYYKSLYPSSPPPDLTEYRAHLSENLRESGRFDALKAMIDSSREPCEARIPEVKARTLVVMGTRDADFSDPAAEAALVAKRLHGQLLMVDGAGHYPHVEMPDRTAPAIINFLKGAHDAVAKGS